MLTVLLSTGRGLQKGKGRVGPQITFMGGGEVAGVLQQPKAPGRSKGQELYDKRGGDGLTEELPTGARFYACIFRGKKYLRYFICAVKSGFQSMENQGEQGWGRLHKGHGLDSPKPCSFQDCTACARLQLSGPRARLIYWE